MELKSALLKRRSIRKFKPCPVSDEYIEELLIAAMSGPSACNKKPWEFYVIKNPDILCELYRASIYSRYAAPLAIVACGNLENSLPEPLSEYWIQDVSAATENILLRATDLGLGAVWCGIYPQKIPTERVKKILKTPDSHIPLNIILIGYPDEECDERTQYETERVHFI